MEGVRKAFAAVGWIVTGQGPTQSSTHVEEDYLCLECAHGKLDQATLDRVLAQVGILSAEYDGDIEGLERPATITIDAEWWDKCTDLRNLVRVLSSAHGSGKISNRKLWLCACAAGRLCKRRWQGKVGRVVDVLERFADGAASESELLVARNTNLGFAADPPFGAEEGPFWADPNGLMTRMIDAAHDDLTRVHCEEECIGAADPQGSERISATAQAELIAVVRDVVGNPFRPVRFEASWLLWSNGTVPKIGQAIYEERAFEWLPILADALLDAGCNNEHIIAHCRLLGTHVRGCWVVDLVLNKL
jgi:hypothetical protein